MSFRLRNYVPFVDFVSIFLFCVFFNFMTKYDDLTIDANATKNIVMLTNSSNLDWSCCLKLFSLSCVLGSFRQPCSSSTVRLYVIKQT